MRSICMMMLISGMLYAKLPSGGMQCGAGKCGASMQKSGSGKKATKVATQRAMPKIEQHFNVRIATVKKEKIHHRTHAYGYIVADTRLEHDLLPPYTGYIETLYIKSPYRYLKKGEMVARIYSPEVYKAQQQYLSALHFGNAKPIAASRRRLRLLGLTADQIAALAKRGSPQRSILYYAPFEGWINKRFLKEGDYLGKMPIARVVSTKRVRMEARIWQDKIASWQRMRTFRVHVPGSDKTFTATHPFFYPFADKESASTTLRVEIDNPNGILRPGAFALLEGSGKAEERLVLPAEAILHKKEGTFVLKEEKEGLFTPVKVTVESIDNHRYAIRSGLHEGDKVAASALFLLDADAEINGLYR